MLRTYCTFFVNILKIDRNFGDYGIFAQYPNNFYHKNFSFNFYRLDVKIFCSCFKFSHCQPFRKKKKNRNFYAIFCKKHKNPLSFTEKNFGENSLSKLNTYLVDKTSCQSFKKISQKPSNFCIFSVFLSCCVTLLFLDRHVGN